MTDHGITPTSGRRWRRARLVATAAVLLALSGGVGIGSVVGRDSHPVDTSAEAGFARDMQIHHAQAVAMSMVAYQRSADPRIRTLAYDIALTQQTQIGLMRGWLDRWKLPATSTAAPMGWMAHGSHGGMGTSADGLMPGMASGEQLTRLDSATGTDLDVLYCQLMVRHHLGGIMMVDGLLHRSHRSEVTSLATAMRSGQESELHAFEQILATTTGIP